MDYLVLSLNSSPDGSSIHFGKEKGEKIMV